MKIRPLIHLLFLALIIYSSAAYGQSPLNALVKKINDQHTALQQEKVFLQTDKSTYLQNDTIWLKGYVLSADYFTLSTQSGLLYVELDDEGNKCVKRMLFPVLYGLCRGYVPLNADDIAEGNYTLRAYTNWMRNFGEDAIFSKPVYVTAGGLDTRLFNVGFGYSKQVGRDSIKVVITMRGLDGQPTLLQDAVFRVTDGHSLLTRTKANTKMDGKLGLNFSLADKYTTKNLFISEQDVAKKGTVPVYNIPVVLNRPEYTDLQFMPEGGQLVAALPVLVGFKAIGESGEGVAINGKIVDSKNNEVAQFSSMHKGMGSFELLPQAGETYTAVVKLPDGSDKNYPLPAVDPLGIGMHVRDMKDSMQVSVVVSPGIASDPSGYYLLGLSRNVVCYAAHIVTGSVHSNIHVPKSAFPTGIAHFTVLNSADKPMAERIVFINHHDDLRINITSDKPSYSPHDSVSLKVNVTDKDGKPVFGSFSMAVTDDSQVKADSLAGNILTNLLCTSDLKGYVEDPGYYFIDNSASRLSELDNLLLTQGWVGYDWKQVFAPDATPQFVAEKEYRVTGSVTNIGGGKPLANTDITILSKNPFFVVDTTTDNNGHFVFKGFLPVDTAVFMIQARNKKGKSLNVQVNVDEFKPPVFTNAPQLFKPWYVNTDTLLLNTIHDHIEQKKVTDKLTGMGHVLKEVKIVDNKVIKDSKNLNGPGESDQALNESDMLKAGKMSLSQLLEKTVKGYHPGYLPKDPRMHHMVFDEWAHFVFDGMYIGRFYSSAGVPSATDFYNFEQDYLDYYTAEDIKGIEVMYGPAYSDRYILQFFSPLSLGSPWAFIEITTRSGHGPFMRKTLGTYLYKPLAATLPKQFYKPKYSVRSPIVGADLRSTIHWEPDIITDSTGHATISFYAADKPASYTIRINGIDLNGGLGYQQQKIIVR
jgi:hypothetical protein